MSHSAAPAAADAIPAAAAIPAAVPVAPPVDGAGTGAPEDADIPLAVVVPLRDHVAGVLTGAGGAVLAAAAAAAPLVVAGAAAVYKQFSGSQTPSACSRCATKLGVLYRDKYAHDAASRAPMCKVCWQRAVFDPACPEHLRRVRDAAVRAGALGKDEGCGFPYWDVCIGCGWFRHYPGDEDGYCPSCVNDDLGF